MNHINKAAISALNIFQITQPELNLLFNRITERAIHIYLIIESITTISITLKVN